MKDNIFSEKVNNMAENKFKKGVNQSQSSSSSESNSESDSDSESDSIDEEELKAI